MPIPFAIPECRIGSCVKQRSNCLTVEVLPDGGRSVSRVRPSELIRPQPLSPLPNRSAHLHLADDAEHRGSTLLLLQPVLLRRTFAEPISDLLEFRAWRTLRLAETQGRVGIVCGGAPGARLLKHLRMPASRATVLRLVRAMPMLDELAPVHVGVDDWAIRKGYSFGTIVVDLDRHRVIDLRPDRIAATQATWLEQRLGI